jgi:hypothetical protein
MRSRWAGCALGLAIAGIDATSPSLAQVLLPDVSVRGSVPDEQHGGYVISSDFQVDPKMSAVIFPTVALSEGDLLSVQPLRFADDEYLVLQECVSADCIHAQILRVWGPFGATTGVHDPNRLIISHDGKYFLWMAKIEAGTAPPGAGRWFREFEKFGSPLVLEPIGQLSAYSKPQIEAAQSAGPVRVRSAERQGSSFVATFETGTVVRLKRMRPVE